MSSVEFPKTLKALQILQDQLNCKTCGQLAENPCTLGGCEHIFCNCCCEYNLENNECPVCNVHVNVKDAQVNRQIFNLVKLCQRLENLLTDQERAEVVKSQSLTKSDAQNATGQVDMVTTNVTFEPKHKGKKSKCETTYDITNPSTPDSCRVAAKTETKKEESSSDEETTPEKVVKNGPSRRKRRSLPADQKTMTQMFSHESVEEQMDWGDEIVNNDSTHEMSKAISTKGKKSIKTGTKSIRNSLPPLDQTTMSQFFDYVDVSDDNSDTVMVSCQDNQKNDKMISSKSFERDKIAESSLNKKSLKTKSVSNNLRTRTKEIKLNAQRIQTPSPDFKLNRRHSVGTVTSRVLELKNEPDDKNCNSKQSRSLSPRQQGRKSSKVKLNTSVTGSGKKTIDPLTKRNAKGETPLQVAAIKGDSIKIQELLKAGATPNTRDNAGWTPLHEAVHYGHVNIAKMLLDHGAMINVPGTENDTPLHDALRQGQLDCVRLLVSRGACITSRNIHGLTPEDLAVTEEMKAALSTRITNIPQPTQELDVLEYQQPCLLPTALSREQKILLQKCAAIIQGRVVEDFCPEVTHIVTTVNQKGMCARTFKYMHGVVNGAWIVNFEWINLCIEFGRKVCEDAFEIPGSSQNIESHAPQKGRTNRKNQLPKLFDGYQFYFQGNFEYPTPDKDALIDLVKSGGGQILSREPKPDHRENTTEILTVPFHAPADGMLSKCSVLVVRDNKSKSEPIRTEKLCSVSVAWVLECIGMFKILEDINM